MDFFFLQSFTVCFAFFVLWEKSTETKTRQDKEESHIIYDSHAYASSSAQSKHQLNAIHHSMMPDALVLREQKVGDIDAQMQTQMPACTDEYSCTVAYSWSCAFTDRCKIKHMVLLYISSCNHGGFSTSAQLILYISKSYYWTYIFKRSNLIDLLNIKCFFFIWMNTL